MEEVARMMPRIIYEHQIIPFGASEHLVNLLEDFVMGFVLEDDHLVECTLSIGGNNFTEAIDIILRTPQFLQFRFLRELAVSD